MAPDEFANSSRHSPPGRQLVRHRRDNGPRHQLLAVRRIDRISLKVIPQGHSVIIAW